MDHERNPEVQPTRKQLVEALAALVVEALRRARANEPRINSNAKMERHQRKERRSAPKPEM